MGQMLPIGQTVPSVGMRRADVAVGYTTYVIAIGEQVLSKSVVWVPDFKNFVEMTQEEAVKHNKINDVFTAYFMLVAHLECGVRGEVVSDKITVEYLRFTQNQYEKFLLARQANPTANSIMLSKEKRTNSNGKDVSSLTMLPAYLQISPAIAQRIEQLTAKPETVQGLWSMVDAATGVPCREYEKWLLSGAGIGQQALPGRDPQAGQLPPMPTAAPAGYAPAVGGYPHAGAVPPTAAPGGYPASGVGAVPQEVQAPAPAAPMGGYGAAPMAAPAPAPAPAPAAPPVGDAPFAASNSFDGDPLAFDEGFGSGGNF